VIDKFLSWLTTLLRKHGPLIGQDALQMLTTYLQQKGWLPK